MCKGMKNLKGFFIVVCLLLILAEYGHAEGLKSKSRIVSGKPALIGQYPWQVVLKKYKKGPLHGSGTIISKDWVLTAAHCLYGIGTIHMTFGTQFWKNRLSTKMFSRQLYGHPQFNINNYHHDIGLIKLPRPLVFTSLIVPIALATSEYIRTDFHGIHGIITGYGYVRYETPNPFGDLLQAQVTIISNEECFESYPDSVIDSTICTVGAESNEAICSGDSGGPLIIRNDYGKAMQVGVISFGAEITCNDNYPSGYARITSYLDFITLTTNLPFKR